MYGAIIGDIIGSPFEFDRGEKTKDFELFSPGAAFTDDTVMTAAVAEALLDAGKDADTAEIEERVTERMQVWGRRYPNAGYGVRFIGWLNAEHPVPYGSFGNGSAMRVSPAGWLYDTMERTREVAKATSVVTHDHPEGIKGAEATAAIIFLARTGKSKEEIRDYVTREFGYRLDRTIDQIRPYYHHVESCQETVPEAITAFMEGSDFEDVVRTAVSLGGDCDTLTDIAAAMAEAFYGMPDTLRGEVRSRVAPDILAVLDRFDKALGREKTEKKAHGFAGTHRFDPLTKFIPLLKNTDFGGWAHGDSPNQMGYVTYSDVVENYMQAVYAFGEAHPEYEHTQYRAMLESHDLFSKKAWIAADVKKLDAKCVIALLTGAIRIDRFCEGTLLSMLENGCVIRWLERLEEIDKEDEAEQKEDI